MQLEDYSPVIVDFCYPLQAEASIFGSILFFIAFGGVNCGALLKPKSGDCYVFCSYGSERCPSMQETVFYSNNN